MTRAKRKFIVIDGASTVTVEPAIKGLRGVRS